MEVEQSTCTSGAWPPILPIPVNEACANITAAQTFAKRETMVAAANAMLDIHIGCLAVTSEVCTVSCCMHLRGLSALERFDVHVPNFAARHRKCDL